LRLVTRRGLAARTGRLAAIGLGVLAATAATSGLARAQVPEGAGTPGLEEAPPERPGLIRAGSFYLTPYLQIGSMGIDTNVFYTAVDRQTDFTASGGPGLEIVRPFGKKSRLRLDGGMDYLFFARTESQRKLNGYGSALVEVHGVKTRLAVEERYSTSFSRPNYEVNARVQQETEGTRGLLARRLGDRFEVALYGERRHTVTDSQDYLGTDVGTTLTEDRYEAGGELRTALSVKTNLVAGGEQEWYRFPRAPERDGDSTLAYGGFRTDETALITGSALGGMRWFRLDSGGTRSGVYVEVDAAWNVSPKTKIGGRFTQDLSYSVFATTGDTPTNEMQWAEVYLDKMLSRTIYLRLFARAAWLDSDGEITLGLPDGLETALRRDRVREAGAEIGYQFRPRVRIGLTATYSERRSTFETFGVEGLLAGLTVKYNPPQPTFR
jgi:hypothetical protein